MSRSDSAFRLHHMRDRGHGRGFGTERQKSMSAQMSASLIGRLGSSAFRTIHHLSVNVARGLVLLFGIGTKALPSWDSKTRWNNLLGGLAVSLTGGQAD